MSVKEIKAVIGKNFGDEGKGRVVDALCAQAMKAGRKPLVIRHNGGAQAGHTVEAGRIGTDGDCATDGSFRFVFHQLGSGSFRGAPVYWSKTFLPDLLKLGEEEEEFQRAMRRSGRIPDGTIYADADCTCVTVYDVLLNSLLESLRGEARHGSCGMGIHETILRRERDRNGNVTFRLGHLMGKSTGEIEAMLRTVRDHYVPGRIRELLAEQRTVSMSKESSQWLELIENDNLLHNSAELMWENFNRYIEIREPRQLLERYDTVIFENAQGLLLDQDNMDYYPHLTPSHTGLHNVVEFLREMELDSSPLSLEVHYVTRTYVTRHGAGRLDFECRREEINPQIKDRTNVGNRWQGELRYAKHPPLEEFFKPIARDLAMAKERRQIPVRLCIDVTHMDETEGHMIFCDGIRDKESFKKECGQMEGSGSLHPINLIFYGQNSEEGY